MTDRSELAAIWEGLISGEYKVKSWSHTKKTWSLVVYRRHVSVPSPTTRDLKILKHALLCGNTSQVAAQARLSKSSVAIIQRSCLQFMGINCTPFRVPGLVFAAAHAHHRTRPTNLFPIKPKITISRPDLALREALTDGEYEVVKLLVEGLSYEEIAQERNTSTRTVANQVASSFRELGVSGRVDLLCKLASFWVRADR